MSLMEDHMRGETPWTTMNNERLSAISFLVACKSLWTLSMAARGMSVPGFAREEVMLTLIDKNTGVRRNGRVCYN